MSNTQDMSVAWESIGGPASGTISAMAIGQIERDAALTLDSVAPFVMFIGTKVGLYRLKSTSDASSWNHLDTAPVGVMALATSPDFEHDLTLVAGADTGIFISTDAGDSWRSVRIPSMHSMILTLCFSPDYVVDGVIVAGTLEDGAWVSRDRGESWHLQSFGLMDSAVLALAISPSFTDDGVIFAGTDTAVYYSYNQGRAWKLLPFPDDAAPVPVIALSPSFAVDGIVYAGTEQHGLYRSSDSGETWDKLALEVSNVNALLADATHGVIVATDAGILSSHDSGETWSVLAEMPTALCLAQQGELIFAGLADDGVWVSAPEWQPMQAPSMRTMFSFALSPQFHHDQFAFMCGLQEGVWRSTDGCVTWENVSGDLPTLDIESVKVAPVFAAEDGAIGSGALSRHLADSVSAVDSVSDTLQVVASSPDGLFLSHDAGDQWQAITNEATTAIAFSPDGHYLCVAFPDSGVRCSDDGGQSWANVAGLWDTGGRVVQLAISNGGRIQVALVAGIDHVLSVWQGDAEADSVSAEADSVSAVDRFGSGPSGMQSQRESADNMQQILEYRTTENPIVSFWTPHGDDQKYWYAAVGNRVWRLPTQARGGSSFPWGRTQETLHQPGSRVKAPIVSQIDVEGEDIVALAGLSGSNHVTLLACTSHGLYQTTDSLWRNVPTGLEANEQWPALAEDAAEFQPWTRVGIISGQPAVALAVSPDVNSDSAVFVLHLGGQVALGVIPTRP